MHFFFATIPASSSSSRCLVGTRPWVGIQHVLEVIQVSSQVVHWHRNVSTVPLGAAGKIVVDNTIGS